MTPDVAVVIPLNNPLGPADDTVTAPLCSTSTSTVPGPGAPEGEPGHDRQAHSHGHQRGSSSFSGFSEAEGGWGGPVNRCL